MDIQVGEHANDYQEIAAKDKLTELQLRIRQLLDQVEQISKEQNYQRVSDREQIRSDYQKSFSSHYLMWSCTVQAPIKTESSSFKTSN